METIRELLDFRFLENILPAKKFQPLNLPVEMIILEGVRRKDEWTRCREVIPDESWIPRVLHAVDVDELGEIELTIWPASFDFTNRLLQFNIQTFFLKFLITTTSPLLGRGNHEKFDLDFRENNRTDIAPFEHNPPRFSHFALPGNHCLPDFR